MATIQVRDVPDDVHRVYRERAAREGMSLQEYLRARLVAGARRATPAEVADAVRQRLTAEGAAGYASTSSVPVVRAEREGT